MAKRKRRKPPTKKKTVIKNPEQKKPVENIQTDKPVVKEKIKLSDKEVIKILTEQLRQKIDENTKLQRANIVLRESFAKNELELTKYQKLALINTVRVPGPKDNGIKKR